MKRSHVDLRAHHCGQRIQARLDEHVRPGRREVNWRGEFQHVLEMARLIQRAAAEQASS